MVTAATTEECDICQEIHLAGTLVTGRASPSERVPAFSRLILRTPAADVFAGLGGLVPGYTLVVPRRHLRSVGELCSDDIYYISDLSWTVASQIQAVFERRVVLVEHGSSGPLTESGGACIAHAHVHLFPIRDQDEPASFVPPDSEFVRGLSAVSALAADRRNYFYCSWRPGEGYLLPDPKLGSQYARRIWARMLGHEEKWDWAVFPNIENSRTTAILLRQHRPSGLFGPHDDALNDTLRAYGEGARSYATRTRAFPDSSVLQSEIRGLADATTGAVLDAGAGGGRDSAYFAGLGRQVISLDASAPLLSLAPFGPSIRRVVGDIRALPLRSVSIGAIWCSAVLLHLGEVDVVTALREFRRVLRSGGLVQISVKEGSGHYSQPMAGGATYRRHFFYYERQQLTRLAQISGLDVVNSWSDNERDTDNTLQTWLKLWLRPN